MRIHTAMIVVTALAVTGCVSGGNGAAPQYTVRRAVEPPALDGDWNSPVWRKADTLEITRFLPESTEGLADSGYRPTAKARVLYDDAGLYVHFRVEDQYVRSVATEYRGKVWEDAAVEFFVQPKLHRGYFNFEINCGGTLLLSYHESPNWKGPVLHKPGAVPWELASQVRIHHSMPSVVDPEITDPVTWHVAYFIPYSLFETYLGQLGDLPGQEWRANFYKCAETNSHPHFGTWAPILEGVDFHSPQFFAPIHFAK